MKRSAILAAGFAVAVVAVSGCDDKSATEGTETELPSSDELVKGAKSQAGKIVGGARKPKWSIAIKGGATAKGEVMTALNFNNTLTVAGRALHEDMKQGSTKESLTLSISTRTDPPAVQMLNVKFADGSACTGNDVQVTVRNDSKDDFDATLSGKLRCATGTVNFEGFAKANP